MKDLDHLSLFEELMIFKSFFIDLIDNDIKKKETKKQAVKSLRGERGKGGSRKTGKSFVAALYIRYPIYICT